MKRKMFNQHRISIIAVQIDKQALALLKSVTTSHQFASIVLQRISDKSASPSPDTFSSKN